MAPTIPPVSGGSPSIGAVARTSIVARSASVAGPVVGTPTGGSPIQCTSPSRSVRVAVLAAPTMDHRDHTPDTRRRLRDLAGALGLLVTGSSDFHGAGKQNRIGENTTAPEVLDAIAEQGYLEVLR